MSTAALRFVAENDLEAYCYLKYALAPDYDVQSFPSTAYYSEWLFHYEITRGGEPVRVLQGDYRQIEPGSLAAQAAAIVEELRGSR